MYDPFESQVRGSCCWVFLFWLGKTRLNYHIWSCGGVVHVYMLELYTCTCVHVGVVIHIYKLELYIYMMELYTFAAFEFELEGGGVVG